MEKKDTPKKDPWKKTELELKKMAISIKSMSLALSQIYEKHRKSMVKNETNIKSAVNNVYQYMETLHKKIEGMEEVILSVYHNLKTNAFLYSYEPEAFLKTFEEIREKIINENKELNKIVDASHFSTEKESTEKKKKKINGKNTSKL